MSSLLADRIGMNFSILWPIAFAFSTLCHSKVHTHQAPCTSMDAAREPSDCDPSAAPPPLLISLRDRLASTRPEKMPPAAASSPSVLGGLVLASQSPRRREILDMMGLRDRYTVEASPLNESELQGELVRQKVPPRDYTRRLAEAKARALAYAHARKIDVSDSGGGGEGYLNAGEVPRPAVFYLGSDTVVELDGTILEKPRDADDAKRMLRSMSGRRHEVHTGVALYRLVRGDVASLVASFTDTASVTFARLREEDIDAYVASGEPMDKAGSYGIQGMGGQLVEEIAGDFFTVMGLPMSRTSRLLAKALRDEEDGARSN